MADWYLSEWLSFLGKRQKDVAADLEWNKAKVSLTASGKQPYTRDDVKQIAEYLGLHPYELLMRPKDALALRQLRVSAEQIASGDYPSELIETQDEFSDIGVKPSAPERENRKRTGTHG